MSSGANGNEKHDWNPEHESHLQVVLSENTKRITRKYRAGQKEHGGRLWEKGGMLGHVEAEVTDLNVYLPTLRAQLMTVLSLLEPVGNVGWAAEANTQTARRLLARILGEPEE